MTYLLLTHYTDTAFIVNDKVQSIKSDIYLIFMYQALFLSYEPIRCQYFVQWEPRYLDGQSGLMLILIDQGSLSNFHVQFLCIKCYKTSDINNDTNIQENILITKTEEPPPLADMPQNFDCATFKAIFSTCKIFSSYLFWYASKFFIWCFGAL